jgi:exosortase/archaeosortase family protein
LDVVAAAASERESSMMHAPRICAFLVALATWDAWRWLWGRLWASPEDLLPLLLAIGFIVVTGWYLSRDDARSPARTAYGWLTFGLAAYASSFLGAPSIVRTAIGVGVTFASVWLLACKGRPSLAQVGLLAIAMPVLPSLQFTLGYPMRIVSAELTVWLLRAQGLAISRQGAYLEWRGEMVLFDAPCSGVNMLWAGLATTLMASILVGLGSLRVIVAAVLSALVAIAANVMRAASLLYVESGLIGSTPHWWHDAVGVAAFAGAAAVAIWIVVNLKDLEAKSWPLASHA